MKIGDIKQNETFVNQILDTCEDLIIQATIEDLPQNIKQSINEIVQYMYQTFQKE